MTLYEHAGEIFLELLELEGGAREEHLQRACAGDAELRRMVEHLLAGEPQGTSALDRDLALPPLDLESAAADPPRAIGPYRIVREIGRGGMGCIYLADRDDAQFRQQVAIKVVHPGLSGAGIIQRFKNERQILANLDHPNIARFLGGGALSDGRPYLVMEFVEGERIDAYCDRHALPVEERLRLFESVCAAVQVAHQNLVVHRDLKPSNILVGEGGEPKLLDFGIAKILEPERAEFTVARTRPDESLMTPEFASPEQVAGQPITTASDVYSLGVILFRLLTGRSPYRLAERTPTSIRVAISQQEPPRPSILAREGLASDGDTVTAVELAERRGTRPERLRRRLAGDIDNIVLTALRKEPHRRYASAQQLSEDIRRHLDGLPVSARPDTWTYRTSKFCRRNRMAVSALTLLLLSLAAFGIVSTLQAQDLERQRARASDQADTSTAVADFLVGLFEGANPAESGSAQVSAADLLDRGRKRIESLSDRPAIQARLLDTIGRSYQFLGRNSDALPLLERAAALSEKLYGPESVEIAEPLHRIAKIRMDSGNLDAALELYVRVLAIHEAHQPRNERKLAESHNNIALPLMDLGRNREALEHLQIALGIFEHLDPPDLRSLATNYANCAWAAYGLGHLDDALHFADQAMQVAERVPEDSYLALAMITTFADIQKEAGKPREAEQALERALARSRALWGEDSDLFFTLEESLAYAKEYAGKFDESIELLRHTVELCRKKGRDLNLAAELNILGKLLRSEGKLDEAQQRLEEALEVCSRLKPEPKWEQARAHSLLALVHDAQGKREEADAEVREARVVADTPRAKPFPSLANLLENVGQHYRVAGDEKQALEYLQRALDMDLALYGETSSYVAIVRQRIADVHRVAGRTDEAERLLRAAVDGLEKGGAIADDRASALGNYGRLLAQDLGRPAEAEALLREALELRHSEPKPSQNRVLEATLDLARCLDRLKRTSEAAKLLATVRVEYPGFDLDSGKNAERVRALEKDLESRLPPGSRE